MVWNRFSFMGTRAGNRAPEVWNILKKGHTEKWSAAKTISVLKESGLSYRRKEMLLDIRRYNAIACVREGDAETQNKVLDYFDLKIEPFRREKGLTGVQAWREWHKWEENRRQLSLP